MNVVPGIPSAVVPQACIDTSATATAKHSVQYNDSAGTRNGQLAKRRIISVGEGVVGEDRGDPIRPDLAPDVGGLNPHRYDILTETDTDRIGQRQLKGS